MSPSQMKLALIGANGMLAHAVAKFAPENFEIIPLDLPEFDMTDGDLVLRVLGEINPDVIVNCAAFTQVDKCESEESFALRVNADGPAHLAAAAKQLEATLVHISTDYVFRGDKTEPYVEIDATDPQSAYGRTKLAGEQAVIESGLERYYIVRTSWLYGPGGPNFVETMLRLAGEREELGIVADQLGTPTYTGDLAQAIYHLIGSSSVVTRHSSPSYGIYHYSNLGQCSWYEFACEIFKQARGNGMSLKVGTVNPITTHDYPLPAKRPAYSVFSKDKYQHETRAEIPGWQNSLRKYFKVREHHK